MKIERYLHNGRNLREINQLLAEIVYSRKVTTPGGEALPLDSEITQDEIFFLYDAIRNDPDCRSVLEIGCAMGVSSLAIAAALSGKGDGTSHVICDPWQSKAWKGLGVAHLRRGGFSNFEFLEAGSEEALPFLYKEKRCFDLVFQDGMHTFDHALLEFFYIDRLTRVGGLVIYDDVDTYSINRFVRYVSLYPHWEIVACAGTPAWGVGRRAGNVLKALLHPAFSLLPRRLAIEFVSDAILRSDRGLGLDSSMIALRKKGLWPDGYFHKEKF